MRNRAPPVLGDDGMDAKVLKIGTRGSRLALAQTEWVKGCIASQHPDIRIELVKITTTGDRILDSPLSRIGGKGLFVKEIEDALLDGKIDLAVHSMKDVPAELPPELCLSVFPLREDARDFLITGGHKTLQDLPEGARVGTSSLRRSAQLLNLRPDFRILPLRGNVETRLRKRDEGVCEAVVLASAGLRRLNLGVPPGFLISPEEMLSAVGQGALGLEVRRSDQAVIERLAFLNHPATETAVRAERAFLKRLEGGCQVPIAGWARVEETGLTMDGLVAELDGSRIIRDRVFGRPEYAEAVGRELADRLLAAGADKILSRVYAEAGAGR